MTIPRHRTALGRATLSKPVNCALADGILDKSATVFDYGCGRGSDLNRLRALGFECAGWDPQYAAIHPLIDSDVVNLGYVVNVIESRAEREEALVKAWALTKRVLVVTGRLKFEEVGQSLTPFEDGYLTSRGTFQKFFDHLELREWIQATIYMSPVAAAPGVFYVFRDDTARESFLAARQRRAGPTLRPQRCEVLFEEHRHLFEAVLPFFASRGRLPSVKECPPAAELYHAIPRIDSILRVIKRTVGDSACEQAIADRRQDVLVYLALARFDRRPSVTLLSEDLQLDIRSLFSSYRAACEAADELLFQVGNQTLLERAFADATVGKVTGNALYVHMSAVSLLPTLLRLYEGCARGYVGTMDGATIVKLHRFKRCVSYLAYPTFDTDPHPSLIGSLLVDLRQLDVRYRDYSTWTDPPILHRKELFVGETYPRRQLFADLTAQEERRGLLGAPNIGTRDTWNAVLRSSGLALRGHRLVRTVGTASTA